MPTWSTCSSVHVPKSCQLLIFTCQSANLSLNMPTYQGRASFSTWRQSAKTYQNVSIFQLNLPKGVPTFQLFSKTIFQFWNFQLRLTFTNLKNIWAILENLSGEIKNLSFDICKIELKKKPYQPKIFDIIFNEARGIDWPIIRLVLNRDEYISLFT